MKNIALFAAIPTLFFWSCAEDPSGFTAVTFDNDTAVHVGQKTMSGTLVKQFTVPFKKTGDERTFSQVYVCALNENIGADTIIVIHCNEENFPDTSKCKTCRDIQIKPVPVSKITELYLPTDFVHSGYSGRFPTFSGKVMLLVDH